MALSNAVVVITGAGTGIGRALAHGFSGDGARVVGFSRSEPNLLETGKLCSGAQFDAVLGDVCSEHDVDRLVAHAVDRYGKIDVLINNAAVYPRKPILESSLREWAQVIEVNLFGVVLCCQRVLPLMLAKGYGRIINLGSFAGLNPGRGSLAYGVSKAALRSFTKAMANEIDRSQYPDVLINELCPGSIRTAMNADPAAMKPAAVYPAARQLVDLPSGGVCGRIFNGTHIYHEDYGIRARIKRKVAKLRGEKEF